MCLRSAPSALRPLRIQVDARLLNGGGIGRYIREITGRWLSRDDVDAIRFFGRPEELEPFLAERDARGVAEVVRWSDGPYSPAAQLRWPLLQRSLPWRADISFLPHYDVPFFGFPEPSVVTVHDLIHFQRPEGFPAWKRVLGTALMRRALEDATAVVTVSDTSRHAICSLVPSVADRVHVVRNGVGEAFRPLSSEERAAAETEWGRLRPFILCVGPNKPHKNLMHAVKTLACLPEGEMWRLVLVGSTEADGDRLAASIGRPDLRARMVVTGPVTDASLRSLYELANAVIVPSTLEGFGLPVLEARACGARVLVRDLPWTRELAMPGVVRMASWHPGAWANEARSLPATAPPLERERWSWARAADATFAVLAKQLPVGEKGRLF